MCWLFLNLENKTVIFYLFLFIIDVPIMENDSVLAAVF
jgi:hypothetical protein